MADTWCCPCGESQLIEPGWVSSESFLAGYGLAQAVPGPLFSFAGFLGADASFGPGGIFGAGIALLGIFLPGFLLSVGVLPFWEAVRQRTWIPPVMAGTNAAVVGILGAALSSPVFTTAITGVASFSLALVCFLLLTQWKLSQWVVVLAAATGGAVLT